MWCGYSGKADLNFKANRLFDGQDLRNRKKVQPFFAQITIYERKFPVSPFAPG
jgi:hypothetical protein